MWNVLDWLNYILFYIGWSTALNLKKHIEAPPCSSLCETIGYQDNWQLMQDSTDSKLFLSFSTCILLLKLIKFMNILVPKTSLAPNVLGAAIADLALFIFTLIISILAFSVLFFVQLGSGMVVRPSHADSTCHPCPFGHSRHLDAQDFSDVPSAFVSLARSLFGDFDVDAIIEASDISIFHAALFLVYLFVVVFVFLSMFFTILGEAQVRVCELALIYWRECASVDVRGACACAFAAVGVALVGDVT